MNKIILGFALLMECLSISCQNKDTYQVFALNFTGNAYNAANNWAVGASDHDSIQYSAMFWLLKSETGKNILVNAGYVDNLKKPFKDFIRPDSLLKRLNLNPSDISDLIITHPEIPIRQQDKMIKQPNFQNPHLHPLFSW